MLKDLPLPSLAALADLIRLPTLAKGIMGDGAVEGGAASFGISRCVRRPRYILLYRLYSFSEICTMNYETNHSNFTLRPESFTLNLVLAKYLHYIVKSFTL